MMTNINTEAIFCRYCKGVMSNQVDKDVGHHYLCAKIMSDFERSEFIKKTMDNFKDNQQRIDMFIETIYEWIQYDKQLLDNNLSKIHDYEQSIIDDAVYIHQLNEAQSRSRQRARQRALQTINYNKANQIVKINKKSHYQFLDNCVIFVCYSTIIGVLYKHHFYYVENNFSYYTDTGGRFRYLACKWEAGPDYNEGMYGSWINKTYLNYTELPIREYERKLEEIGISHLQRVYERDLYYNADEGTWLNVASSWGGHKNTAASELLQWIKNNLDFDKERYEIYIHYWSKCISLKIWDRKLQKYKTLGRRKNRWSDFPIPQPFDKEWRYGFKPLRDLLLKQGGFKLGDF